MSNRLIKPQAKRLFLEGKEVSDIIKIFPQLADSTLYTWIQKEKWREIRDDKIQVYTKSPDILLDMLNKMMQEIPTMLNDPELTATAKASATAKISDSISKICRSIKNLSKDKDRFGSIIFAVEELGKYMNSCNDNHIYNDEFRVKFDKLLSGFQERILEKYSTRN